ncbi:MAG: c-type cytochrome, partial [Pirellulaceae bacterium]|nr:c-type cytochrome [Pirellulaceae bacterium]
LAGDRDAAVRFEVTLALGGSDAPQATEVLRRLAVSDGEDAWFVSALLTGCRDRSGQLLAAVVQAWAVVPATAPASDAADERIPQRIRLVRELATVAGARGDLSELSGVMNTLAQHQGDAAWWQSAALSGLATGLARHRGGLGRTSLAGLLANPPAELADRARPLQQLLANAQSIAVDGQRSLSDRLAAIELLGYRPYAQSAEAYGRLLSAGQPITIQLATLDAMRATGDDAAAGVVLDRWAELGPRARASGLELLLRKTTTTRLAMEGMAEGKISPSVLDIDQRVRLLRHGEPAIRELAARLFGGAISANRREVARQYESALSMEASVAEGAKVFERACAKCHRVDGQGHVVGPDISDVRNRSRDALLYDILDPNLKIEPRFTDYTVVTDDGRVFNGLMDSETSEAVVLLQAEGKRQVIPRTQIEQLRASGKSLMPEGVEKEITVEQMAHLLEFLKARVPTAK